MKEDSYYDFDDNIFRFWIVKNKKAEDLPATVV